MPRRVPTHRAGPSKATVRRLYEHTASRQEDKNFYSSGPWLRLRALYLAEHPLCHDCEKEGRFIPAVHVHHLVERKERPDLALEYTNLQGLCLPCHNRKRKRPG